MAAKLPQARAKASSTNWTRMTEFTAFSESGLLASISKTSSQFSRPVVESRLLGFYLRGWLTDRDKEFLDSFAPEGSLALLIRGNEYLHPEGIELFPFELIETAIKKGGDAVFTHRYQRASHDTSYHYTIYTAVIESSIPKPLVLGFFGPDDCMRLPETLNRFHELVALFREACRRQLRFAKKILQRLQSHNPTIIVNRCSGRVLALNETAAKLLQRSPRSLVDLEFGEIKTQLLSILPGHKLIMTNLDEDELYLTIISVNPPEKSASCNDPDNAKEMLQKIHSQLRVMTLIIGELESLCRQTVNDELSARTQQLIEVIEGLEMSTTKLSKIITRWRLDNIVKEGEQRQLE